jgi:hypothetical protein
MTYSIRFGKGEMYEREIAGNQREGSVSDYSSRESGYSERYSSEYPR